MSAKKKPPPYVAQLQLRQGSCPDFYASKENKKAPDFVYFYHFMRW